MNNLFKQSSQIAFSALKKNKGRAVLTILGIVIASAAVVSVLSIGQAIRGLIIAELDAWGSDLIEVEIKTPQTSHTSVENAMSMVGGAMVTTLKENDARAVAKLDNIAGYYTGLMGQKLINYRDEFSKAFLFGTNASFIDIDPVEISAGRFFSEEENQSLAKVAVLGNDIKDKLFGLQNPINEIISIGADKYKVAGVLSEKGTTMGFDMDNMIFLPISTLQKRVLNVDYVTFFIAKTKDPTAAETTAEEIIEIMRQRHQISDPDKDDFAVMTMEQMKKMTETIIIGIQILLIVLGAISLIVGGVGIMNIMYVSVSERSFEIGLRKAVGADSRAILWQFLTEAVILTMLGAMGGILLGLIISIIANFAAQSQNLNWHFSVSVAGLILSFFLALIVGLLFGIYPARQAAQKNPIDALRAE